MKRFRAILLLLPVLLTACHSKQVAYISDAERDTAEAILQLYTAIIMPGDQLYIHVSSQTPESVIPFNQESHKYTLETNRLESNSNTEQEFAQSNEVLYISVEATGYIVNDDGQIVFPILGKLDVAGITQDSLKNLIEQRLISEGYVTDPLVTTRLMNFRVTVMGEVRVPRQIHVQGTRLTILEALAICGDLTPYGKRENVTVMRFDNAHKEFGEIDLTKKEMLDSPFYYLHNNDIIYVEPNNLRKKQSDRDPDMPRYISTGVAVASLIRTTLLHRLRIREL